MEKLGLEERVPTVYNRTDREEDGETDQKATKIGELQQDVLNEKLVKEERVYERSVNH